MTGKLLGMSRWAGLGRWALMAAALVAMAVVAPAQSSVQIRIFADPPLNFIDVVKSGPILRHASGVEFAAPAHLSGMADGAATVAFHPHHLALAAQTQASPKLIAKTQISEITGSESFVHVDFNGVRWVMLAHGIHDIDPDTEIAVYLDTRHLMAFGPDGRAIATGNRAA